MEQGWRKTSGDKGAGWKKGVHPCSINLSKWWPSPLPSHIPWQDRTLLSLAEGTRDSRSPETPIQVWSIKDENLLVVMEQPLVLSHLILSTMPLPSYQMNYPTLQFDCVIEQPLSPLSYLFDLINYASLILLNKLSILFHPIIVWPCGRYYKVQVWAHV